jgi:formate dehydrogenase major subunit
VGQEGVAERLGDLGVPAGQAVVGAEVTDAATALAPKLDGKVAVVLAPSRHSASAAMAQARAAINLTIALAGADAAPASLHILPPENNVIGLRDVGVTPTAPVAEIDDDGNETQTEAGGLGVAAMLEAARSGSLKALIVAKDNPVLLLPDRANVRAALEALDLLLVIDDVPTETVQLATHVLADVPGLAKDGSITNADRQIIRLRPAIETARDARPAWQHLQDLAQRLSPDSGLAFADAGAVLDAIAADDINYVAAAGSRLLRQTRQPLNGARPPEAFLDVAALTASESAADSLALVTGRDLYSDREAAAASLPDADRLQRAEFLELHPDDAATRGLGDGDQVTVGGNGASVSATIRLNEDATPGTAFLPLLWQAGAVQTLIGPDDAVPGVVLSKS